MMFKHFPDLFMYKGMYFNKFVMEPLIIKIQSSGVLFYNYLQHSPQKKVEFWLFISKRKHFK